MQNLPTGSWYGKGYKQFSGKEFSSGSTERNRTEKESWNVTFRKSEVTGIITGFKKSAVQMSGTSRFLCWESNFSHSLA